MRGIFNGGMDLPTRDRLHFSTNINTLISSPTQIKEKWILGVRGARKRQKRREMGYMVKKRMSYLTKEG